MTLRYGTAARPVRVECVEVVEGQTDADTVRAGRHRQAVRRAGIQNSTSRLPTDPARSRALEQCTDPAIVLVAFRSGVLASFPYAGECFQGFGRGLLSKPPLSP